MVPVTVDFEGTPTAIGDDVVWTTHGKYSWGQKLGRGKLEKVHASGMVTVRDNANRAHVIPTSGFIRRETVVINAVPDVNCPVDKVYIFNPAASWRWLGTHETSNSGL